MILLNRKIDYALLIMWSLHHSTEGGTARNISARFGLSRAFVANILKELCHKGFVVSQRGVKGGYYLKKPVEEFTLVELIDALEDRVQLTQCARKSTASSCTVSPHCPLRVPMAGIHSRIRQVFANVTLADLFGEPSPNKLDLALGGKDCCQEGRGNIEEAMKAEG
jgi:Rrf2 family iron-sulfur cluster assembly transcriptional regulator